MNRVGSKSFIRSVLCVVTVGLFCLSGSRCLADESTSADEQVIRQQANDFAKDFASGDTSALSKTWSDDCAFTDSTGKRVTGRTALLKHLQEFTQKFGSQPMVINIDSLSFPAADVCLEQGVITLTKTDTSSQYDTVHVKRNGEWKTVSVVESRYTPKVAGTLKDLSWLVGDWTAKNAEKDIQLHVYYIANQNFLVIDTNNSTTSSAASDMWVIGWSYKSNQVVSWHFGADGGFGLGHWQYDNPRWLVQASGVRPDGAITSADYRMTKIDDNHYEWQSINRMVNQERMPDSSVVKIERSSAAK